MFCLKSGNVTVVSHNLSYAAALNTVQCTSTILTHLFLEHMTCWYLLINAANVFCFRFYNLSKSIGSAEIATTSAIHVPEGDWV